MTLSEASANGPAHAADTAAMPRKRLHGAPFWAAFALTCTGLLLTINQTFNLGLAGFRPIATAYYYLTIGVFLAIGYLAFPARKGGHGAVRWYDWLLAAIALGASAWLASRAQLIIDRGWNQDGPIEATLVAGLYVLLALEALRRTGETILLVVCLILGAYPLYAGYMPGFLWGVQLDPGQTVREHVYGLESIIGIPMQVVCDTLIGFIVFGVVLASTGGGAFFMDFASALMGRTRGGPAKVAIVSSGLFGMLSGSPTSDVVVTGTLTIPTMKRLGYPPVYAGAVEACASTGGALMPPVMGAAAFIMANFLNVPYSEVVTAAFLPAFLYYGALMLQTDFYAARHGLRGVAAGEVPPLMATLAQGWYYIAAILALIVLILVWRIEGEAPYWVSLFLLGIAVARYKALGFNLGAFCELVVDSGRQVAQLICLIAGIGLIVGAMSVTGVANSFSRELVQYAGGNLWLLLGLGALTSFILGMGMTASACYIFLAIVLAPALIAIGVDPMAAHLYIFYWGIVSFITPPVALAAIASAAIAKADPMAVGFKALRVGSLLLVLPVIFVLQPALILKGSWPQIAYSTGTAIAAITLLAAAAEGYLWRLGTIPPWARALLGIAGLALLIPEGYTDLLAAVVAPATIVAVQLTRRMRGADEAQPRHQRD
jgi:TRAP transporter 4TM/12TM fusion protein